MPFYARRVRRGARLEDVPFLTKDEAIAHQRELVARGTPAFAGVISSGTQPRAGILRVPRTEAEARAARVGERDGGQPSLVLEVRAVHHGLDHLQPRPHWLRIPWTYSRNALRLVESVLSRPQPGGQRVRRLLINAGALMPLTAWLRARSVDARRFGLEGVSTTGFRLTRHWRALVEETWGAPVFDNFSLSELPSPALECHACGFNHWQPPPVWPEVVDPLRRRPITTGVGVLVVTTLFPFVQAMPLLRYWTGDLVELGPRCRTAGERGFRFRGRVGQSLFTRDGLLVGAQDVVEALEAEPLVARHPHPMESLGILAAQDCGAVKFELSRRRREVWLRVELKFDPRAYPLEAEALGGRVASSLLAASPTLSRLERARRAELVVEVVRPGTLARPWVKL